MFFGLRDTYQAKLFWTYYILRRLFVAGLAVFLGPYQAFQIQALLGQSFVMLGYFVKVQPFEISTLNFLQIFNELIVISAICHMFIFSEGMKTASDMRVSAGWSFDLIIAAQIVVNMLCLGGVTSQQVYRVIRQKIRVF